MRVHDGADVLDELHRVLDDGRDTLPGDREGVDEHHDGLESIQLLANENTVFGLLTNERRVLRILTNERQVFITWVEAS